MFIAFAFSPIYCYCPYILILHIFYTTQDISIIIFHSKC